MRRLASFSVLLLIPAIAGGCHKQADPAPQAEQAAEPAAPAPARLAPDTSHAGKSLPTAEIKDGSGASAKLSDLKGKPVLVNLWATWCVPCVKELPTLDALAAREAGTLQVVVVNMDLEGPRAVEPFLKRRPLKTLKTWTDASNALMIPLEAASLPTTILYKAEGKEVWRVARDVDWTSAEAKALLAQAGA
ncbi:TlpA family protein disulfide reductase [Sphingomonas sp.]|uniref:TlpA family protein disulfide reductase n=1 Tax=Sphingomonas sp. TaxID=28214 RepID=UPI003B3AE21B